jgi:hypothetical protein
VAGQRTKDHRDFDWAASGFDIAVQSGQSGVLEVAPGRAVECVREPAMADPFSERTLADLVGQVAQIAQIIWRTVEDTSAEHGH